MPERYEAEAISGYLYKASGLSWPDCLGQTPLHGLDDRGDPDLLAGRQYYLSGRPPIVPNWTAERSFVSFETSNLRGRSIRDATFWLEIKADLTDTAWVLVINSQGSNPFGSSLESGDWDACGDRQREIVIPTGIGTGLLGILLPGACINPTGQTQFRLRNSKDTHILSPPADRETLRFYGAADSRRPYLMVNTGNVYDDGAENIAELLTPFKTTELGVKQIHPTVLPYVQDAPEIQIGWTAGRDEGAVQEVTYDVYYLDRVLPPGTPAASIHSVDKQPRITADKIRRILRHDQNCQGYFTKIVRIETKSIVAASWGLTEETQQFVQGSQVSVTYRRELGEEDLETV